MDSDSDDDILPSANAYDNLFSNVHRQARGERSPSSSSHANGKPTGSTSKKSSVCDIITLDDDIDRKRKKKSHIKTKSLFSSERGRISDVVPNISDEIETLLAQANSLVTKAPTVSIPAASTSTAGSGSGAFSTAQVGSSKSTKSRTASASSSTSSEPVRGRGKKNTGRGRKTKAKTKPKKVPVVVMSDDDDVQTDTDIDYEASTQEVMEPEETPQFNYSRISEMSADDIFAVCADAAIAARVNAVKRSAPAPSPSEELVSLRIEWKDKELRLQLPKGTKVSQVRMEVAQKFSLRADDLMIMMDTDTVVVPDNQLVEEIPFGKSLVIFERDGDNNDPKKQDPNFIQLKVQGSGGHRERLTISIRRTTHIHQLLQDYVKKFGLEGKTFNLVMDGEVVDLSETAETLDLDGGEIFDIVESKS